MALQALWSSLEYEHVEAELLEKSRALEAEMYQALEDASTGYEYVTFLLSQGAEHI